MLYAGEIQQLHNFIEPSPAAIVNQLLVPLQDFKINLDFNHRNRHSRADAVEKAVLDTLSISISKIDTQSNSIFTAHA
jgi:hypothetical protein